MHQNLRAYEMVETSSPDEISAMKQRARVEHAQRLRREKKAAEALRAMAAAKEPAAPRR
ncbi:hypothetical protein GI374_07740 [Paracoccus sp. S-4012]|uniref:hypothetical protein n=1 Tax=Paracoccus sp. S-4012 TaxID=2665648 RepID=UPI0012B1541E|nr:hypothetical protein [Paracoccus sp. S-4012]MRX50342.1 hypothetical protein [Paracoccus sp. S-4012]